MQDWNEAWLTEMFEAAAAIRAGGQRPVAAFDFDQTCIEGDLGAQFHLELSRRLAYALGSASGLREVLAATPEAGRLLSVLERADRGAPVHQQLTAELACLYSRVLKARGGAEAAAWAPLLHAGLVADELESLAEAVWEELLVTPPVHCEERSEDGLKVVWQRGLRPRPRMVRLIGQLEKAGVEVRVVSQTNVWALRAAMGCLGLPQDRAVGSRCEVRDGVIQPKLVQPTTYREGKVACHAAAAGEDAVLLLAAGDSENDIALLGAARFGLWVERGDGRHLRQAKELGWMVVSPNWLMQPD